MIPRVEEASRRHCRLSRLGGVSGFTVVSDDPRAIERYGREVAPALREVVARERRPAASA